MKFIYLKNNFVSVSPDIKYYNDIDIYTDDMYEWLIKYKKLTYTEITYFKYGCKYMHVLNLNGNNMDSMQYNISKNCADNVIKYIKFINALTPSEYETEFNVNVSKLISYNLIIQIGKSMCKNISDNLKYLY